MQRWLKFSKYLPDFGWQPVIYTPENPSFDLKDESLEADVHEKAVVLKKKIREPLEIYKKLRPGGKGKAVKQGVVNDQNSQSFLSKLVIWVRGNLFFPDPRKYWVKPSVKFLRNYIGENDIEVIVTTGPPHSMHLIGMHLKEIYGEKLRWLADFRDPWSEWDILKELKTTRPVMKRHAKLEKKVLRLADEVITVSKSLSEALGKIAGRKVRIITNGFDKDDIKLKSVSQSGKFTISHIGLMNELRNPGSVWQALRELCIENSAFNEDLEIFLAGAVSSFILEELEKDVHLSDKVKYINYLSHEKVFAQYSQSAILLLLVNTSSNARWILPGKAFEYIAVNRPVLALGAKGIDLEHLLREAGHDSFYEYADKAAIKAFILNTYQDFRNSIVKDYGQFSDRYERRELSRQLSDLLNYEFSNNTI